MPGSEGETGGLIVVSSPWIPKKQKLQDCRILGAHKSHRHDMAVELLMAFFKECSHYLFLVFGFFN